MDLFLLIFRDTISGFLYFLYLGLCIFAFFYVFGFVATRKRKAINDKLKEKKQYDIASGREAAIAAMETKQVLNVEEEVEDGGPKTLADAAKTNAKPDENDPLGVKKEEVPSVMVLNSSDSSGQTKDGPQVEQPLVIDTSSVK